MAPLPLAVFIAAVVLLTYMLVLRVAGWPWEEENIPLLEPRLRWGGWDQATKNP